jgi:hypothetical protein
MMTSMDDPTALSDDEIEKVDRLIERRRRVTDEMAELRGDLEAWRTKWQEAKSVDEEIERIIPVGPDPLGV